MWDCDCSLSDSPPVPPVELYFTEFIPDYFPIAAADFSAEVLV